MLLEKVAKIIKTTIRGSTKIRTFDDFLSSVFLDVLMFCGFFCILRDPFLEFLSGISSGKPTHLLLSSYVILIPNKWNLLFLYVDLDRIYILHSFSDEVLLNL